MTAKEPTDHDVQIIGGTFWAVRCGDHEWTYRSEQEAMAKGCAVAAAENVRCFVMSERHDGWRQIDPLTRNELT